LGKIRNPTISRSSAKNSSGLKPTLSDAVIVARTQSYEEYAGFNSGPAIEIWVRIAAFLSLRSPNTQSTYTGILREWMQFLKADYGTALGARIFVAASDLHSAAYRNWLLEQPGEVARMSRSQESEVTTSSIGPVIKRLHKFQTKNMGLEGTQSNATIAKKLSALRRIYRMVVGAGLITRNPFDSDQVPSPSKDSGRKRPTEMLEYAEVRLLLQQPDTTQPKGVRDAALLAALFGGALRRSEAAALKIGDVKFTTAGTMYLYLRSTKAKSDARQAVPAWAAKTINALLAQRKLEAARDGDFLFISYSGKGGLIPTRAGVSVSGLYKLFKQYCRKAGISSYMTPHSARATAITKLLADGVTHREVKEFSRHASIQMVEVYDKRRTSVDENPAKDLSFEDKK